MNKWQRRNLRSMGTIDDKFLKTELKQCPSKYMGIGIEVRFAELPLDRYLEYRDRTEVDCIFRILQNLARLRPELGRHH